MVISNLISNGITSTKDTTNWTPMLELKKTLYSGLHPVNSDSIVFPNNLVPHLLVITDIGKRSQGKLKRKKETNKETNKK
jgi:hypothetical protein